VLDTRILGYARSKMSDEKFDEQVFWKIRDDEKEGHIKANDAKKEEFRKVDPVGDAYGLSV
jgi:glucose-6-phosphate 1-dehydrogenase